MSSRTLIRGGCVLTLGARTANFAEADVLIEDARIIEVGPGLRARDAEQVDARDAIVMPGFVDAHRHLWRTLLRNGGGTGPDGRPRPTSFWGPHHQPDDVYAATLLGLLSAAQVGITTVVDWSDIQVDGRYTEATLQAHADAGLRTVFVHAVPAWATDADAGSALRRVVAEHGTRSELTTIASGSTAPVTDPERIDVEWSLARDLGLRIHVHAGVDRADAGAVATLGERALLGADVTVAHGARLDGPDLDAVAARGAAIALTPSSDMANGLGPPPLQQLLDRGTRPGLGTDDEQLAPGDLFAQMRAVQSLQHATYFDRKLAGKGGLPNLLTTREVIRYATLDGARAVGLADVTGSLEVGKRADVLILRTDRPNISPVNDPIGAVVWGMDASNVDTVFVGGRALVRDGALQADTAQARHLALAAHERVTAAAGRLVGTGPGGAT